MKNCFRILAFSLCLTFVVQAAPPTDASIEEMMKVMQIEKMLGQMVANMDAGMKSGMDESLKSKSLTPAQMAKAEEVRTKISARLKNELSFAKTKDIYMQVYRETFTQEEISSLIAFYGSPAGKAMMEKVPIAMQKSAALMQVRIGPMMQEMQSTLEAELQAAGKTK